MTPVEPVNGKSRSWLGAAAPWSGLLALGAVAGAVVAARAVAQDPVSVPWGVVRLGWLAVLLLAAGAIIGSERLVASSVIPILVGLLLANGEHGQATGAESLVVGCVWFLAVEAALASIECRGGLALASSVVTRRVVEAATVLSLAVALGLVGLAMQSFAPERSLLVRTAVASSVLVVLFSAVRRSAEHDRTPGDP